MNRLNIKLNTLIINETDVPTMCAQLCVHKYKKLQNLHAKKSCHCVKTQTKHHSFHHHRHNNLLIITLQIFTHF